jgi:hypothetical protein
VRPPFLQSLGGGLVRFAIKPAWWDDARQNKICQSISRGPEPALATKRHEESNEPEQLRGLQVDAPTTAFIKDLHATARLTVGNIAGMRMLALYACREWSTSSTAFRSDTFGAVRRAGL